MLTIAAREICSGPAPSSRGIRLAAEMALVDTCAEELEKAHAIISIMLNCLSGDAKQEMSVRVTAAGLDGEGVTRARERDQLLARVATQRVGRSAAPVNYAHEKLVTAATLARRQLKPLLADDLSMMASALADVLDAASTVVCAVPERTPACKRLRATLARFGVSERSSSESET